MWKFWLKALPLAGFSFTYMLVYKKAHREGGQPVT